MNAKEYLEQIESLTIRIEQMENRLECMRETAGGAAAIRYDKERVQTTIANSPLERDVLRIIELSDDIFELKMKWQALVAEAKEKINALENENDRIVLTMHYIQSYSFGRMSAELCKDIRWLKRVNNRALDAMDMLYKD